MNSELEALEAKIEQVVALVHQLRAENDVLKNQMAAAESERLHLRQTMTAAGAAHENTARRPVAALAVKLDTWLARKNVAELRLACLLKFFAVNHGDIGK